MTKKELRKQIISTSNFLEGQLDIVKDILEKLAKRLDNRIEKEDQRYQMLLDHFNLKEEEYAELDEEEFATFKGLSKILDKPMPTKAVKKVKLVKKK